MKLNALFLIVLTGFGGSSLSARTYTLPELLQLGLENSKEVKMVFEEQRKVASQVSEAYGKALPSIDLTANYSYAFEQYSALGGGMSGGSSGSIADILHSAHVDTAAQSGSYVLANVLDNLFAGFADMTKDQTASLTLSINQALFAQGKVGIGLTIAKVYREGLEAKYANAVQSAKATTTRLFYAALLAKKRQEIQQESVTLREEVLRLSRIQFAVGKGSELDTISARLGYEKSLVDRQNAEDSLHLTEDILMQRIGLPADPSFDVTGEFIMEPYLVDYETAQEKMEKRNYSLIQLKKGLEVQNQLVKLARSDHYPMIYCGASLGKISQFNQGDAMEWYDNQSVFVGMKMNLFNGFTIFQKTRQAQSDKRSYEVNLSLVQDGLDIGLKNAVNQLDVNHKRLESSVTLLKLAEKGYVLAKKAYEVGSKTLVDLNNAEIDWKQAKLAFHASQFGYLSAVIDVKLLLGEL
ncbi:MAG: hypothetical protein A2293_16225 [Elusimicrobia bacterium RIFOXYB2_FULL_49_7]|nr:MAG: hypothetical protein A2293_16225 [Elusimicrobia bacterium RIFOXYB2_FULL_49_7]